VRSWLALAIAGAVFLASPTAPRAAAEPIAAVATIGMVGDVVANVGGACVKVTTLIGPGIDPHLFQASARDVQTFSGAEAIFYSGHSLEGQLGEVLARLAESRPTVAVAEAAVPREELIPVDDQYGVDPHVWMDASLWARTAPVVAETIAELRPDCAEDARRNGEAYAAHLQALHKWIGAAVATIPEPQRILVTAHDAFNYFGRAYGIEVAGIQGISTESEAGIADIREMARIVAERKVPAIFVESTINPRTIQAVIEAAAQRGHNVRIGGSLYSDAMGQTGTAGGTYIGMLYDNTTAIVTALGGTLPPLPSELGAWAAEWKVAGAERAP